MARGSEWMVQVTETYPNENDAREAFSAVADQDGYRGGRVMEPNAVEPRWKVQAFFQDEPEAAGWLPDGMRRVMVPDSVRARVGVTR